MTNQEFKPTGGNLKTGESLKKHTTFHIGGKARYFYQPENEAQLREAIDFCLENGLPWKVLGKGSNVLIDDDDFNGMIISFGPSFSGWKMNENGLLEVQAGTSLIALAYQMMREGWSGLEFASGIPGSVGGGLFMNAGAYRKSLSDCVREVLVFRDGRSEWMDVDQLEYGYRKSLFQEHPEWIILGARIQLEPGDPEEIQRIIEDRKARRESSQPQKASCAGSVFRNPDEGNAWKYIDAIGYRGKKKGGAMVSEKHSNFIVNENGEATFEDVSSLIDEIQEEVESRYGIRLHPEIERVRWSEEKKPA